MNKNIEAFAQNVGNMLIANRIDLLIPLIISKFLNVEMYSYVQLYIFYTSYVCYLHYGWVDGIRLRYAGDYYEKLDKRLFSCQIRLYLLIQVVVSVFLICCVEIIDCTENRRVVLIATGIYMLIRLPRLMLQYIMEMSNRIKECAFITVVEKIVYLK